MRLIGWVVATLGLASPHAMAEIKPWFQLEVCAWHATDIVVASEGDTIDGELVVQRVLAGGLSEGERLFVPELAAFRTKESRTVKQPWKVPGEEKVPEVVVGGDVVLFLKRPEGGASGGSTWAPASTFGGMRVSVAWLSGGDVHGFTQVVNPGPSVLVNQGISEKELEQRVARIVETREALNACEESGDTTQVVQVAAGFVESPVALVRKEAFRLLSTCGEDALPFLRSFIQDSSKAKQHGEAIRSFAVAGGDRVASELAEMMDAELAFWSEVAPTLSVGWWQGDGLERPQLLQLRERYSVTLQLIRTLQNLRTPGCDSSVESFRDYWRSLPQLEDESGLNQMSQACDDLLKEIRRSRPERVR